MTDIALPDSPILGLHEMNDKVQISYDLGGPGFYFDPKDNLERATKLEEAGFDGIWFPDHFKQFFHTGAHCPQAWVCIASALEKTHRIPLGVAVTIPMYRYHPLTVAHVFATLGNMYPGRVRLAVGTGEAVNELTFLDRWPGWSERAETLVEAVQLIRHYWTSDDYFDHKGKYFRVRGAYCYDKPKKPIPIYVSGLGPKSAYLAGQLGDALMTSGLSVKRFREEILPRFEAGARAAGKDPNRMDKLVYLSVGYGDIDRNVDLARRSWAGVWPDGSFDVSEMDPRSIEKRGKEMPRSRVIGLAHFYDSAQAYVDLVNHFRNAGSRQVMITDVSYDPDATIDMFKKEVLPRYK